MEQSKVLTVHVQRSSAERSGASGLVAYEVPCSEGMSIMDALRYIQENIDSTLAFDCSCRIGICGACAVRVNGEVSMACSTVVRDGMRIEPVDLTKARRDLIVRTDKAPKSVSEILKRQNPVQVG